MKQCITIDQLKELNQKELKILNNFISNPYLQRIAYPEFHKSTRRDYIEAVQDMNIGKMIEILYENIPENKLIDDSLRIECDRVTKTFLVEYRLSNSNFIDYEDKELCNALWKAIKNILKEKSNS